MLVLITADIHNGVPGKLKDCIWSMDVMRQYANKHGIKTVFVCGDLFHDRVSLGIDTLNAVYDQLKQCVADGQEWICFPGNHDMYLKNSWECNSLHILKDVITIFESITKIERHGKPFWILPFVHYESKYMEMVKEVEEKADPDDVLLTHIGVNGATLNECFLLKNWNIVSFVESKFKKIFTGHFHCHQQVGENCWYPGSPIPFRFDEGVVDHGFIVYNTETGEMEFVKIFDICQEFSKYRPPDYLTIIDEDLVSYADAVRDNHIRIQMTKEYSTNELASIKNLLRDKKGALTVNWVRPKNELEAAVALQNQINGVGTPEGIFESWLTIDKPEERGLSTDFLRQLFSTVKAEADERVTNEDEEE